MPWLLFLIVGVVAGAVLGALFFGGLWWTSRRLVTGAPSAGFVAVSFAARMLILALGLIVLARLHPAALVGALPGLVAARLGWTRAVGPGAAASGATTGREA